MALQQNYGTRGKLGFLEDNLRTAVVAFVEGDEPGYRTALINAGRVINELLQELKGSPAPPPS